MFSREEKQVISKTIINAGKYFGSHMEPEVVQMIIEMFESEMVEYDQILIAYKKYSLNPKNRFWPKASEIMELIRPTVSEDAIATATVLRIEEAICKFGWSNPQGAKEFVGELGWKVIQRNGGWKHLCEDHGTGIQSGTFHAQTRTAVKATLEMIAAGRNDEPIALPEGRKNEQLKTNVMGLLNIKTISKD